MTQLLALVLIAAQLTVPSVPATPDAATLARLVGQKLVVAMSGGAPSADLLGRIGRGEVGGVILFGDDVTSAANLRALTGRLSRAASDGGQPPLLIVTDQEGGAVARVPWAPPTLSVPEMGDLAMASIAASQGEATGQVLRCAGINGDLAPVADVPGSAASFMRRQGRTWSASASLTATLSDAFASGLEAAGSVPAMKHFPGIGLATDNTDSHVVTITASASVLAPGLLPYRTAIGHGIPLIMLSNATYPAWDGANAAGWSHAIGVDLLRGTLGFTGVTMTDSLSGTAAARGVSATSLAVRAARAGTDMILVTGSERSTRATYEGLLRAAQDGRIPVATLEASYDRILALKATLRGPVADASAPEVRAPVPRLYAPSTLGAATVPVRTSWSADDPCAISAYALERRVNGGAWTRLLSGSRRTSIDQSLGLGARYGYAARAADGAGNRSGWVAGRTVQPLVRQSSSVVRLSAGWSDVASPGYSGGTTRYALAAGASATYTFTGSSIGWVAATGPTRGSADVYVDGAYAARVTLHAATTSLRRIVFAQSWPSQGTHTIRIVVVGSGGHPRVDVDAFVRLYRP